MVSRMIREDMVDDKIKELIEISAMRCRKYKEEVLIELIKTILITADECCENCTGCRELNGCVLTRINEGYDNIFGSVNYKEL